MDKTNPPLPNGGSKTIISINLTTTKPAVILKTEKGAAGRRLAPHSNLLKE